MTDRYMERTAHRLEQRPIWNARWQHSYAIGMDDARYGVTRGLWDWTNFDRGAYHEGWMAQMGAR